MTADTITVRKGKEKWEIGRDANTKAIGTGAPAAGETVTIKYWMTAASIEVKPAK